MLNQSQLKALTTGLKEWGAASGARERYEQQRIALANDPERIQGVRNRLNELTNKHLEEEKRKAKPGFFSRLTADKSWEQRAMGNARTQAMKELTSTFTEEDWELNRDLIAEEGEITMGVHRDGKERQDKLIDRTNTAQEFIRYLPGAGIGEWGANTVRTATGDLDQQKLLQEQLGISKAEYASMSPEDRESNAKIAAGLLTGGAALDLIPGGGLLRAAGRAATKNVATGMTRRELAKSTAKELASKQGMKGIAAEGLVGGAGSVALGYGVSRAMGADHEQAVQGAGQAFLGGVLGGVAGRPITVVQGKLKAAAGPRMGGTINKTKNDAEVEAMGVANNEFITNMKAEAKAKSHAQAQVGALRATAARELDELDIELENLKDPEYLQAHGLTRSEEADIKYQEIIDGVMERPEVREASGVLSQAEDQLNYYNEIRTTSPFAIEADMTQERIQRIEASRQEDMAYMNEMMMDSDLEPAAVRDEIQKVNANYDRMIEAEQAKLAELEASDPQGAMEYQALIQSEQAVLQQRDQADEFLQTTMANIEQTARQETDALRTQPNAEAVKEWEAEIAQERDNIRAQLADDESLVLKGIEDAEKRFKKEMSAKTTKDVDNEIQDMNDGIHPMQTSGKGAKKQAQYRTELYAEKNHAQAKETLQKEPGVQKTQEELEAADNYYVQEAIANNADVMSSVLGSVQQIPHLLRHLGQKSLASLRTKSGITHARLTREAHKKQAEMIKKSKGNSSKDLFDAADGDQAAFKRLNASGQEVIREWQAWAKDLGKQLGLPEEMLEDAWYIPHLFAGRQAKDEMLDIQVKMRNLMRDIESGVDAKQVTRRENQLKELNKQLEMLIEPENRPAYDDFIKDNGDIYNRFLQKRRGDTGYQRNFHRAVTAYVEAANTKIAYSDFVDESARIVNLAKTPEGKSINSNLIKVLTEEMRNIRGKQHSTDENMNRWFNELVRKTGLSEKDIAPYLHNLPTKTVKNSRMLTSLSFFAGSVSSMFNTMAQIGFAPASINIDGTAVGLVKASGTTAGLVKNLLTRQESKRLNRFMDLGVFEGRPPVFPDSYNNPSYGAVSHITNKVMQGFMAPLTAGDRFIRIAAAEGAEFKGKQLGLSGDELDRYIIEKVTQINGNFSKMEAPRAFRSQAAKSVGQSVAWMPGMGIRTLETAIDTGKGWNKLRKAVVAKVNGREVTGQEIKIAIDEATKGLMFVPFAFGVGQLINQVTGQDEVIPNPFSRDFYQTPGITFLFGNEGANQPGLKDLFPGSMDKHEYDENGNLVNVDHASRVDKFISEILPRYFVPGWSQINRTRTGMEVNEQGYSETEGGNVRYVADSDNNLQRAIFGQYSTPEGREYIDNMGMPGGGSLRSQVGNEMVKNAPEHLRNQYYDFFRAAQSVSGRNEANKEVTELYRQDRPAAAQRKAAEYNAKVNEQMDEFFKKYPNIDSALRERLRNNLYITLTEGSEAARTR